MSILNSYTEVFKPAVAIIAYQGNLEREQEWYLESHPIVNGTILEGKPLQQDTLNGILALMYSKQQSEIKIHKFIPHNLLFAELLHGGDYKMVWFRPEERRMLYFHNQQEVPNGEAWVPAMIYMASKKTLAVYAVDSNEYPTEETKLYKAPFRNIYGDGKVCLGSAKAQKPITPSYQSLMKYHEDLFWGSEFASGSAIWKKLMVQPKLKWSKLKKELKPQPVFPKQVKDLVR